MNKSILLAGAVFCAAIQLHAQAIVGSWYGTNHGEAQSGVLTFLSNGTYYLAFDGDSVAYPDGQDGMERGTYTWNAATGEFHSSTLTDTDGGWGLNDSNVMHVTVVGNSLVIDGEPPLSRVTSTPSAIVGSWFIDDPYETNHSAVITFLSDGSYFMAEDGPSVGEGHSGMERGTYTWNPATSAFSSVTLVDTSGDWGLSDGVGAKIFVSGDVMTLVKTNYIFTRVAAAPTVSIQPSSGGQVAVEFVGVLQIADEFGNWSDLTPQVASPALFPMSPGKQFFRTRRY